MSAATEARICHLVAQAGADAARAVADLGTGDRSCFGAPGVPARTFTTSEAGRLLLMAHTSHVFPDLLSHLVVQDAGLSQCAPIEPYCDGVGFC